MPGGKAGTASAKCRKLTKELKRAAAKRVTAKQEFRLRNDTSCKICFIYDRCNNYGCWDQAVRASAKSTLFAGVRAQAPTIKDPQFCQ
jgi:hypothetical protein